MSVQLKNDLFLRALAREKTERTPVWMMRQAGRYLPEYRETRRQAGDFLNLCKSPEKACEVTLQPLERYKLDASILFSDILTIPDAMGLGLYFVSGEGPCFQYPVRRQADVQKLATPDPEDKLRYVMDAVRLIRSELDGRVPLIGFAGSPWTVATYMVEGGATKSFSHIKGMLYAEPALAHEMLSRVTDATVAYLNAQVAAGAQAIMVFDTWGGALSPADYREFSLRYMQEIVERLTRENDGRRVPCILFTKGGGMWLNDIADTGCDGVGVDWTLPLGEARQMVGDRVALQGNLDPSVLYAPPERIREEVGKVLASFGHGSGHVFNLGHGIHPNVDPAHAGAMIDAVHELSPAYHQD